VRLARERGLVSVLAKGGGTDGAGAAGRGNQRRPGGPVCPLARVEKNAGGERQESGGREEKGGVLLSRWCGAEAVGAVVQGGRG
jgi:hypothetical protein